MAKISGSRSELVANKNSNSERLVSVKVNSGNVSEAVLHQRLLQDGQLAGMKFCCVPNPDVKLYILYLTLVVKRINVR